MAMTVLSAGTWTTVQDLGRTGVRAQGVASGGAVDSLALQLANLAVGNARNAPGLECTLTGPRIRFESPAVVAVAGALVRGIEPLRPTCIPAGTTLSLERLSRGCRAYLAVAGGFDVPLVLGGRGTDVRTGIGGWKGRPLRRGDLLPIGPSPRRLPRDCRIDATGLTDAIDTAIRILRAPDARLFKVTLHESTYRVGRQSDRMGMRLSGPRLQGSTPSDRLSFPIVPGAIQIPPFGEPIVLLADAQTVGGYPVVAHVISADLFRIAQRRPGDAVRFTPVTLDHAEAAAIEQQRLIGRIELGMLAAQHDLR